MNRLAEHPEETLAEEICRFVRGSPANSKAKIDRTPFFDVPLVGFAEGDDPLFAEFKHIISDFHLTPREALAAAFPAQRSFRTPVSVIAWVLPITAGTRQSNRDESRQPSKAWAHTRTYGEEFNNQLRAQVVSFLQQHGIMAVAPATAPYFEIRAVEGIGPCSNWSERHAAYAAGLGTFGLHRGLITAKGVAVRCGSVVAGLQLKATPRTALSYQSGCLFYASGTCGLCIRRCPVGAITQQGHDKAVCLKRLTTIMQQGAAYDAAIPGCGLCHTGVPCEAGIPECAKK